MFSFMSYHHISLQKTKFIYQQMVLFSWSQQTVSSIVSSAIITYLLLKLVQGFMAIRAMKAIVLLNPFSHP